MNKNPETLKSLENRTLILIILIIIIITGCMSNKQEIEIHKTSAANEIIYEPDTQIPLHPGIKDTFPPNTKVIYACANVTSTPGESVLKVRWLDTYGNIIFEESKTVACDIEGCWNCFNLTKNSEHWEIGNYTAEFLISGAKSVQTRITFRITGEKQKKVCLKDTCFYVELAVNESERALGLMFREKLDSDEGMLFIFEEEKKHTFWMKNTLIPLDMIWINKDKEVVYISRNTKPCTEDFCPVINPAKNAMYVLEINGGISDKIRLQTGDKIMFDID